MPIYEYTCAKCRTKFEQLVKSADAPNPPCPSCGSTSTERSLSVFAVSRTSERAPTCTKCGTGPCPLAD